MKKLEDLIAAEVSLVNRGANRKKRFPVTKNRSGTMDHDFEEVVKSVLENETDDENKLDEIFKELKVSEKGQNAAKGALRLLSSFKDEMPKGLVAKLQELAGYEKEKKEEDYKYPEPDKKSDVKKWVEGMPEEIKKFFDDKKLDDEGDDVTKNLDPAVQEILKAQNDKVKDLEEKNEKIEKSLKEERDKRELEGWVTKAEKELTHYPGKSAEEMGKVLKSLNDVDPKLADEQFAQMKEASEMIEKSDLLRETGRRVTGDQSGSVMEQVNKMAEGIVEKSEDLNMTKEKAINKVFEMRPELYEKYLSEHPRQS